MTAITMSLSPPKFPSPFRRSARSASLAPVPADAEPGADEVRPPVREPDDEDLAESLEPGWRASSYELRHGLDVVELPTSLPPDVLDRLFNAPGK
jgi:hypothetical protein